MHAHTLPQIMYREKAKATKLNLEQQRQLANSKPIINFKIKILFPIYLFSKLFSKRKNLRELTRSNSFKPIPGIFAIFS